MFRFRFPLFGKRKTGGHGRTMESGGDPAFGAYEHIREDRKQLARLEGCCRKLKRLSRTSGDEQIKKAFSQKSIELQVGLRRDGKWGGCIRNFRLHMAEDKSSAIWVLRCRHLADRIQAEFVRRKELIDSRCARCEKVLSILNEFSDEAARRYIERGGDRRMITRMTLLDPTLGQELLNRWKTNYIRGHKRVVYSRSLLRKREKTWMTYLKDRHGSAAVDWASPSGGELSHLLRQIYNNDHPTFQTLEELHRRLDEEIEGVGDHAQSILSERWSKV